MSQPWSLNPPSLSLKVVLRNCPFHNSARTALTHGKGSKTYFSHCPLPEASREQVCSLSTPAAVTCVLARLVENYTEWPLALVLLAEVDFLLNDPYGALELVKKTLDMVGNDTDATLAAAAGYLTELFPAGKHG